MSHINNQSTHSLSNGSFYAPNCNGSSNQHHNHTYTHNHHASKQQQHQNPPHYERISLNQQFYASQSPSATLTPGRKSASPHFFHSNDFFKHPQYNAYNEPKHQSSFGGGGHHHVNGGASAANFHNISTVNYHHNNYHAHNHHGIANSGGGGDSALNHHNHHSVMNNFHLDSYNLKLPTTPTRSKSLSPSLRCVMQPPRLRYKQENKINSEKNSSGEQPAAKILQETATSKKSSDYFFEPISEPPPKIVDAKISSSNNASNVLVGQLKKSATTSHSNDSSTPLHESAASCKNKDLVKTNDKTASSSHKVAKVSDEATPAKSKVNGILPKENGSKETPTTTTLNSNVCIKKPIPVTAASLKLTNGSISKKEEINENNAIAKVVS